ncbi:MAG TPA: response regulator [Symbiobacteriaceae bacterium]|nr:response regulator [Symbiobacteriaceae bacterium]
MQPIRVLVVDDDPMVQQVNREYVESVRGFRVVGAARTAREAIEAVASHRPDLVLLDVYMPDQDGVATLKEIRQQGLPADVIMVSAAQDAQTIQNVLRYGAVDYIIKPFRLDRLKTALETYRAHRWKLGDTATLDQEQVDRMLRAQTTGAGAGLPKGLHEATLRQVHRFLAAEGQALTAAEVADKLGMARVTARRYLDHLVKLQRASLEIQYGAVGRPLNRYRSR